MTIQEAITKLAEQMPHKPDCEALLGNPCNCDRDELQQAIAVAFSKAIGQLPIWDEQKRVTDQIVASLLRFPQDRRERIIKDVLDEFCAHCGDTLEGGRCHCMNDE